jgi:LacI family transcriptional regulator
VAGHDAVTIQDVANRAKVSISTVSHVLNKTRHVERTRHERVLAAIEELGYRPNQLARGLRGVGSKTIGLIISDIREEFFAGLTKAVESAANERGYLVTLCDSEEDPDKEARYLEILSDRGVDGIIFAPVDRRSQLRVPRAGKLPLVMVDRRNEAGGVDFVGIDNARLTGLAVRHLVGLGRRNLGLIVHEPTIATMGQRAEGFSTAMKKLGLSDRAEVLTLRSRSGTGKARLRTWLAEHEGLEGIICGNANLCFTLLTVLEDSRIKVPDRIAVVSFDDPQCFSLMRSPITAIRQPTERIGTTALGALLARIENRAPREVSEFILPARLIVRESCGCRRREDAHV